MPERCLPDSFALAATNVALGTPAVTLTTISRFVETGAQTSVSAVIAGVSQGVAAPLPSGGVQFYDSVDGAPAQPLGPPIALSPGNGAGVEIATFATNLPRGRNVLFARYLGDANWAAARSANSASVIVNPSDANPAGGNQGGNVGGSSPSVQP